MATNYGHRKQEVVFLGGTSFLSQESWKAVVITVKSGKIMVDNDSELITSTDNKHVPNEQSRSRQWTNGMKLSGK